MTKAVPPATRSRYTRLSPETRRHELIEAALACIAEGGIRAFTVDRICQKAHVSRGLVTHHFGSMSALLAAVYDELYADYLPPRADEGILALLDQLLSAENFNRDALNIWLSMWTEISNSPELRAVHRARYQDYRARVAAAITRSARKKVDAEALATRLICLIDGLGLQHCIDPETMPQPLARLSCLDLLTPFTGPLT